jgi:hypothetical protein
VARKIHVQLIDDLSGEDAQESIRFSVEGTDYEIDLSADNAADLRETLKRYTPRAGVCLARPVPWQAVQCQ